MGCLADALASAVRDRSVATLFFNSAGPDGPIKPRVAGIETGIDTCIAFAVDSPEPVGPIKPLVSADATLRAGAFDGNSVAPAGPIRPKPSWLEPPT